MQRPSGEQRATTPMVEGARWYRDRLRKLGLFVGLTPMVALGATAWVVLNVGKSKVNTLVGLIIGSAAAPGLLVAGGPLAKQNHFLLAVGVSAIGWMALGWWASRRATTSYVATWADYWREMTWMIIAVFLGVIAAFLVAAAALDGLPLIN